MINFLLFLLLFQVSFDLGTLYFYQEKFPQAMKLFESCKNAEVCHKHLLPTYQWLNLILIIISLQGTL